MAVLIAAGAVDRSVAEATVGWMIALGHHLRIKDQLVRTGQLGRALALHGIGTARPRAGRDRAWAESPGPRSNCCAPSACSRPGLTIPLPTRPLPPGWACELVALDELLQTADFVSIHCPLNAANPRADRPSGNWP